MGLLLHKLVISNGEMFVVWSFAVVLSVAAYPKY